MIMKWCICFPSKVLDQSWWQRWRDGRQQFCYFWTKFVFVWGTFGRFWKNGCELKKKASGVFLIIDYRFTEMVFSYHFSICMCHRNRNAFLFYSILLTWWIVAMIDLNLNQILVDLYRDLVDGNSNAFELNLDNLLIM